MPKTEVKVKMSDSIKDRLGLRVRIFYSSCYSQVQFSIAVFAFYMILCKDIVPSRTEQVRYPFSQQCSCNELQKASLLYKTFTHTHTHQPYLGLILGLNDITTHTPMSNDPIIAQLQKYVNIYDSPRWNLVSFSHNNHCHQDYLKHFLNLCSEFFPGSSKTNFVLLD